MEDLRQSPGDLDTWGLINTAWLPIQVFTLTLTK